MATLLTAILQSFAEGVMNTRFGCQTPTRIVNTGRCLVDHIIVRGSVGEERDPVAILKPFFEEVFNRFGVKRPTELDTRIIN